MLSVKQYQKNLRHYYGYYGGSVDGIIGSKTRAAVKAFQKGHGLSADGIYGTKANAKLVSAVKSLQKKIGVTADGIIGSKTVSAIKKVQKKYGLAQDGIAGTKTMKKLNGGNGSGSTSGSWNGSEHFKKSEMKCRCGGRYCNGYPASISPKLMKILETLRKEYKRPISITSGLRCSTWNARQGGVSNSAHKYGKAADIYIPGICDTPAGRRKVRDRAYQLGAAYSYCNTAGMGNAVHINV